MSITEKISHAAERKAFETILDSMPKKGQTQDVGDLAHSDGSHLRLQHALHRLLGGGALLTTQYTIHTPFQKRPTLLSVSDGRVGLSVTAPCDRLYEALAGALTSPASAAQARTSATDASVSNRVPGRKIASGSSA